MAQSASSQVPITVPASVVASIQPAALVVGPTVSVLGAQITTKAPTTIAAEVLGASIVAPSTSVSGVAFTGSDVAGPVRLSLTLGLAGGGLVLIARGRRRPRV